MKTPPAFQYYPRDLLCDANVMAMSLEELGAYWKLVSVCWLELGLPGTETGLARLLQISSARFKKIWPALEPCFVLDEQGRYQHPRLNKERAKQDEYRKSQANKGKRSAALRADGQPEGNRASTELQPEGNREATEGQPEANSAICYLLSADSSQVIATTPPQALADLWNEVTSPPLKRCKALTLKRERAARARLSERPLEDWREVYRLIQASDFCRGSGRDGWVADFDFALKPDTAIRVLEGKYDNRAPAAPSRAALGQKADDFDEIAAYHREREAARERQKASA